MFTEQIVRYRGPVLSTAKADYSGAAQHANIITAQEKMRFSKQQLLLLLLSEEFTRESSIPG
jgi:hypothetical protein